MRGDVYLYDIQKNIWKRVASMNLNKSGHSCAVITPSSTSGNVVLVCGGGKWQSDCRIYDPATDSWTNGPSLPFPLSNSAMVTAAPNSKYDAFILGGSGNDKETRYSNSQKIYGVKDLTTITLVGTFEKGRKFHVALKNNFC